MTPVQRRNVWTVFFGDGLWGAGLQIVAPAAVLTVLLRRLDASEQLIGVIPALEGGLPALLQLLGVLLFKRVANRKRFLLLWHGLVAVPSFLVMGLIMYFAHTLSPEVVKVSMLVAFGLFLTSLSLISALWAEWISLIFDQTVRGRAIGMAIVASCTLGSAGAAASGYVLRTWTDLQTYAYLYFVGGAVSLIGILVYTRMQETEMAQSPSTSMSAKDIFNRIGNSLSSHNFRMFLTGRIFAAFGFCIIPFIAVNYLSPRGGSLEDGTVVFLFSLLPLTQGICALTLGRVGDKRGHRLGMRIGGVLQVVTLLILLFGHGPFACAVTYICAGACAGCAFISHYNLMFETCPHESHLAHITVGNLIFALGNIVGPLLGGRIAQSFGLDWLFTVCLIFSSFALFWFLFLVKEPRTMQAFCNSGESNENSSDSI